MFINQKAVKQLAKESGHQVSKEFITRLDVKVKELVDRAILNARHFKRLTGAELL